MLDFPERVLAIYIREVTTPQREMNVQAIADEVRSLGVDMLLVDDTIMAAKHAAAHGYIAANALSTVSANKTKDDAEPGLLEQVLDLADVAA